MASPSTPGPRSDRASVPARLVLGPIRLYQRLLSPAMGRNCRFSPTCSSYAVTAITRFGVMRGGWLAAKRLGRCQPLVPAGYDPVPDSWSEQR